MPPKLGMPTNENEGNNLHSYAMDMQASINQNRNEEQGTVYHVFDASATRRMTFGALKGGIKLLALLLDEPPPLCD